MEEPPWLYWTSWIIDPEIKELESWMEEQKNLPYFVKLAIDNRINTLLKLKNM